MKNLNQYVLEKLKLSKKLSKDNEAIEEPSSKIPSDAEVRNEKIKTSKGDFNMELTIMDCMVEDDDYERFNLLDPDERFEYSNKKSNNYSHVDEHTFKFHFYAIITNPKNQTYSFECEMNYFEGDIEFEYLNSPFVEKWGEGEEHDNMELSDYFPEELLDNIVDWATSFWKYTPPSLYGGLIEYEICNAYNF